MNIWTLRHRSDSGHTYELIVEPSDDEAKVTIVMTEEVVGSDEEVRIAFRLEPEAAVALAGVLKATAKETRRLDGWMHKP